jgi:glutamine synthetase adenylyltransferase
VLRGKWEGIKLDKWVFELNYSSDIAKIRKENRERGTTGGRTQNADFFGL